MHGGGKADPFFFPKGLVMLCGWPLGYGYGTLYLIQIQPKNLCLYHKPQIHLTDVWEQF